MGVDVGTPVNPAALKSVPSAPAAPAAPAALSGKEEALRGWLRELGLGSLEGPLRDAGVRSIEV